MTTGNPRLSPLLATIALTLLVFGVLPVSMYLGNLGEFLTHPGAIVRLLLVPAALLIVLALAGLRLSRTRDFSRFSSVVAMLTLLAWVEAYLLVWDYGLLDGSPIEWGTPAWRAGVDAVVWLGGIAAAVVLHRRLVGALTTAAMAVVVLQATLVLSEAFTHRKALALKASQHLAAGEIRAMARFSSGRNALHIVLDSFQADVFHEIVTGPGGADVQASLAGFTYFEEHLGTFPATYLAMPTIVSGQVYRNQEPRAQFMESAYAGRSLLNAAQAAGFEVDIAGDAWLLDLLMKGRFDNAYLTAQLPLAQEAARLLDLALFRLSPHPLKPWIYNEQKWLTQRLVARSELSKFAYFTHNAFVTSITRNFSADRAAPVYKFFHLMTPHAPFVVHPDCSPTDRVMPRIRETVTAQSRCSLAFVVRLLNRMKEAGIYDDSLIVLMGDHGGHIPPVRYRPRNVVQGDTVYDLRPDLVALATPLLAIKPPGDTGAFRISPALTSMTDVAATIDALLGLNAGMPGKSLWDDTYGQSPDRRFYGYHWSRLDPVSEYIEMIQEITVSGSAYQAESWQAGRVFLPPEAAR